MPPSGGLADKIGNRYEGRHAVLRLLQLMDEEHDSVRVRLEQPGEDSFEWWVEHRNGSRTYTQVKRQLAGDEQWTTATLVAKGIIKDFGKRIEAESTARCEFCSTLSASHLQELSDSARMAGNLKEFEDVFAAAEDKKKSWNRIRGEWDWWSPEESRQALRNVTVAVISEPLLETLLEVQARMLVAGNPETAISLLGSYLEDHLCEEITAQDLWDYLAGKDLTPNDWGKDPSTRARINTLNQTYVHGVAADRGPLAAIRRKEAATTAGLLTSMACEPSVVAVTGVAGMGKSDLLGQVVEELTTPSAVGTGPMPVVLAARLDRLAGEFRDAAGLGAVLGLPESPAVVLSRLAAGGPAVLVLDQVDAFSSISGRHPERFHAVTETLRQADAMGVRVLLACRTFDFTEDDRMLGLAVPAVDSQPIDLGPLPVEDVERELAAADLTLTALPPTLRELVRAPLHLRMLVTLRQRGEDVGGITTRLHLFDRFFKNVIREVQQTSPGAPVEVATAVLAQRLSDHQELTAPEARLSQYRTTVDQLISAGWLRKSEGRIGFAHEAFFDYAYAYHHASEERSLLDLLRSAEQHLFRRSQVRQILTLEREQDRNRYLSDLRDVLGAPDVRPHIKELVIAVVTSVPDPTPEEWKALTVLGDGRTEPLADRAHALAARSPVFGELLLTEGVVAGYLADPDTAGFGAWLCQILVRNHPDQVAALLQPHAAEPALAQRIIGVINLAPLADSDAVVELFETLITAGVTDDPRHDVFTLLYATTDTAAASGARIAAAYMRRRLDLHLAEQPPVATAADQEDEQRPDTQEPETGAGSPTAPAPASVQLLGIGRHTASDVIGKLAGQDPAAFVHHILPVVRAASAATRTGQSAANGETDATFPYRPSQPPAVGSDNDVVLGHLTQALRTASAAGDAEAHAAVREMAASDLATEQVLAAAAFAVGHTDLLDDALTWLNEGPFAFTQGWLFHPSVFSAETLAHVCQHRTPEQTSTAQQRAASATNSAEERGKIPKGTVARRLLAGIPAAQLTPETLQRRAELDTRLGANKTAAAAGQPPTGFGGFMPLRPPISLNDVENMADVELAQQLNNHTADGPAWQDNGQILGGAISVAEIVTTATERNPERFTALLEGANPLPGIYTAAILRGLDKARAGQRATVVQVLRAVKAAAPNADTDSRHGLAVIIASTIPRITDDDLANAGCAPTDLVAILRDLVTPADAAGAHTSPPAGTVPRLPTEPVPEAGATPDQIQLKLMEYGAAITDQLLTTVWQRADATALDALRNLAQHHPEAGLAFQEELLRLTTSPYLIQRLTTLQVTSRSQITDKAELAQIITTALDAPGLIATPGLNYPADTRILLAAQPLHALVHEIGWGDHAAAQDLATRMLDLRAAATREDPTNRVLAAVAERAAHNGAAVTTRACATDPTESGEAALRAVASGQLPERLGVAAALSDLQPVTAFPDALIKVLLELCDDPNDEVAMKALTTVREIPGTEHPHIQDLLTLVPCTRAFELNPEPAISAAKRCQEAYPALVLDLAGYFFELHGKKTSDISSASSAHAHMLAEVVTSIYTRQPDGELGSRALDLIDTMVIERSLGLESHLGGLDR
ncbi:hypothetical protein [Kitasatospora viridis]|uniref:Uncharacterized protein n=1 Tax=Kitasatospora viridis TaxID=281105 RepID=A0A561S9Y6_9ACTN|nr:hypothetical protein [Kitasatospora viridis]TWF71615.1 hypothetical protein FHX73_19245 [Kitasatospora viridis]